MVQSDVVYPVLHGGFGEDGELQKKLENARLRFVGSSSVSSALVMDKIATKRLLDEISLPTAPWAVINKRNRSFPENLQFPVVVKAPCEGSSVGVVKVSSADEWDNALDAEFKLADELLVEEFLPGAEITVPVINASALEVIEIVPPSSDFYTWDAKYDYKNGETQYFCPPKTISDNSRKLAREYALKFYHAAGCRDILRVDFIVGSDGVPRILEGNSLPGNTDHSLVPKAARQAGISMEKMCATLVYAAMKRSGDVNQVKKISFWGLAIKKLQKFADGILNLASLLTGLTLGWAGMRFDRSMLSASALLTGGILLVFLAVTRTLDRKK